MRHECPVYQVMNFIGKRWSLLIMLEMSKGRKKWKRYSEIKGKMMNITPKILALRLRELEQEGLVKRRVHTSSFPVKSEYRLTTAGEDFVKVARHIKNWALKWKVSNRFCKDVSCRECDF